MRSPKNYTRATLLALSAALLFASGCYVYADGDPHDHGHVNYCPAGCVDGCDVGDACHTGHVSSSSYYGDLSLAWGFEDALSCGEAGVREVVLTVEGIDTPDHERIILDCHLGGTTLLGLTEGWYFVRVSGLDVYGTVTYEAELEVEVLGGMTADIGVLVLNALYAPPPPPPPPVTEPGSLALDWAFRYPDVEATYDCAYAGVEWIEVDVIDEFGTLYWSDTVACAEGPAIIDNFDPGRFEVELSGIGLYQGEYIELYRSPIAIADVYDNAVTDIGVVDLDRDESKFGDFMLDWSFAGHSCEAEGVNDVTVRIIRSDIQVIDDEFTVPCYERPQLRATFVPGDYEIEVSASDVYGDCWYGAMLVDLIPNTMTEVELWTELVSCY